LKSWRKPSLSQSRRRLFVVHGGCGQAGALRFCELTILMPDDQDIRRSLARAFDRAWDGYYRSGRVTISRDVARTELARKLVQLSKDGVRDEARLSAAGLIQLTTKDGK
jgi:hypothetical protein